jgi:hypothetical protein
VDWHTASIVVAKSKSSKVFCDRWRTDPGHLTGLHHRLIVALTDQTSRPLEWKWIKRKRPLSRAPLS